MRSETRPLLTRGLQLVVSRPGAVLWTYAANLGLALLFSLRLNAQLSDVLSHSLASQRLNSAFDLGTLGGLVMRLQHGAPATGVASYVGVLLYLLVYFVLVPGSLFCYQTASPARLAILASLGLQFFWRFVRITLLTAIVSALILGPLMLLNNVVDHRLTERLTGMPALLAQAPGLLVIALVAAFLRLYFDLVEVYTVHLNDHLRASGQPDRRVRRTLAPALRTLLRNLPRAFGSFILLTLLGLLAVVGSSWMSIHLLAQPHVAPIFLLGQLGLTGMLLTRFWQRGAETTLALDNPMPRIEDSP